MNAGNTVDIRALHLHRGNLYVPAKHIVHFLASDVPIQEINAAKTKKKLATFYSRTSAAAARQ